MSCLYIVILRKMQLHHLYLLLFFFSHVYLGCSPACTGINVCVGTTCKTPNDGITSCMTSTECADSVNGGCISGVCDCNGVRLFSVYQYQCLIPNDGSSGCTTLNDCVDSHPAKAQCSSGQCICGVNGGVWRLNYMTCSKINAGNYGNSSESCAADDRCTDQVHGYCSGYCYCDSGYGWNGTEAICLAYNNNSEPCNGLNECWDHSSLGFCNGQCTCITAYGFNTSTNSCTALPPNDNTHACSSISNCADSSAAAICSTNCTCNTNYVLGWSF